MPQRLCIRALLLHVALALISAAPVVAQQRSEHATTMATLRKITLRADDTLRLARAEISASDSMTVVTVSDSTGGTTVAAPRMLVQAPIVLRFPDEAFRITVVNLDANIHVEMPPMADPAGALFQSELSGKTVVFTRASVGAPVQVEAQRLKTVRVR